MPPRTRASTAVSSTPGPSGPKAPAGVRPAIPVNQSFAYGSPGRIALPRKLDRSVRQLPVAQAIDNAIAQSMASRPPAQQPAQTDEEEEGNEEEDQPLAGQGGAEDEEEEEDEDEDEVPSEEESDEDEEAEEDEEDEEATENQDEEDEEESEDEVQDLPPINDTGHNPTNGTRSYYDLRGNRRGVRYHPEDFDRASMLSFTTESYLAGKAGLRSSAGRNGSHTPSNRSTPAFSRTRNARRSILQFLKDLYREMEPQVTYLLWLINIAFVLFLVYFFLIPIIASFLRSANERIPSWWPTGSYSPPAGNFSSADLARLNMLHHEHSDLKKQLDTIRSTVKAAKLDSIQSQQFDLRKRIDTVESSIHKISRQKNTASQAGPVNRQINFFARSSGAQVDPHLTSPTRRRYDVSGLRRLKLWMRGELPSAFEKDATSAFKTWDDVGDCWCAPEAGGKSQLAIISPWLVVPKELVVEHINKEMAIEPGAAPKDVELWVQILDDGKRERVAEAALTAVKIPSVEEGESGWRDNHAPDHQMALKEEYFTQHALDHTWVRIGRWQYDINLDIASQVFSIPVDLERYEAPVKSFAVRTLNNWGGGSFVCLYRLKLYGLRGEIKNRTAESTSSVA